MTNFLSVDALHKDIVSNIQYNTINSMDMWRVELIKEIIEFKQGNIEIEVGWDKNDLDEILNFACTS